MAHNIAAEIQGGEEQREFNGKGYCFIETGFGKAGFASGEFYAEPRVVNIKRPRVSRIWHWGKALFEKYWLWRWFYLQGGSGWASYHRAKSVLWVWRLFGKVSGEGDHDQGGVDLFMTKGVDVLQNGSTKNQFSRNML
ncbi:MAG: hypothetical protein ACE5Z5_07795 [Candidatus Bathyarchaeia archaeon]